MSAIALENKTILVTGAAGFIGSNLVKRICEEVPSAKVVGIDSVNDYKDAAGLWHEDRFRPLCTALANLVMNLILVQFIGIYGILLSTVLSTLFIGMPWVIVFGHSQDFVHSVFPDSLVSVIGYGGIGVTMFAFLSGIGLWHSLDNNDDILNFYKKRIKRVIIPYLLIAIPFCLFLDIYEQKDVLLFLQDITCISYWIKGRGAWYVAWLIPVYAVYPLYGRIAHNRNWLSAVLAIVEIIMIALIGIPIRFQSVAAATLAFLIGDFLAKFIKANSVWTIRGAASLILIAPVYFFGILRTQTMVRKALRRFMSIW